MFKELLGAAFPLIEKAAPVIAGVLGSPGAGLAANWVISLLANKFGVHPSDLPSLSSTIMSDPDCDGKLCDLETSFSDWFKNLNFQPLVKLPSKAELHVKIEWGGN